MNKISNEVYSVEKNKFVSQSLSLSLDLYHKRQTCIMVKICANCDSNVCNLMFIWLGAKWKMIHRRVPWQTTPNISLQKQQTNNYVGTTFFPPIPPSYSDHPSISTTISVHSVPLSSSHKERYFTTCSSSSLLLNIRCPKHGEVLHQKVARQHYPLPDRQVVQEQDYPR